MLPQIKKYLRYLWILFFCSYSFAETIQVKESFLWLRISKSRGNTFFRVFVDNSETPYVNLQEMLTSYLDFSKFQCDEQRQFCNAVLASQGNARYWFDFKSKQCGSDAEDESTVEKKLEDSDWQIIEESPWVKYNVLEKCLPVEARWDLKLYYLSIIPSYPLVEDLLTARERARLYNIAMQKKREQISKIIPMEPTLPYRFHGKYGIEYKKLPEEQSQYKMNYDFVGDIFKGTLKVGGDVLSNQSSNQRQYWIYTQKDKKYFKSLDVGDVFYEGSDGLLPSFAAINGLKLDSRERSVGANIKTAVRGQNLPGTDVELYRNSFFLGSMVIPANGVYAFEDIFAAGGDNLLLKFYYSDGSTSEKNIKVADDGARLIPYKEGETRLFSGKTPYGNFSQASYRHGIHRKASLGLSAALLTEKEINVDDHQPNSFFMADFDSLPFKNLNFRNETLIQEKDVDVLFRMQTTWADPHIFNVQYKHVENLSPLLYFRNDIAGYNWRFGHGVNLGPFQISDFYQETINSQLLNLSVIDFITSNLNLFATTERERFKLGGSVNEKLEGGFRYRFNNYADARLSRAWLLPSRSSELELNLRGGLDIPWNARVNYVKPDEAPSSYSGQISYTISRVLTLALLAQNEGYGVQINWNDVVSQSPGPRTIDEFATGTISGKLFSPADELGNTHPVADALISIDGRSVQTDANGYYILSGISPYRNVQLKVDPMGMDVSMAPKNEFEVFYFRPGTHIEYNPELVSTVGLDGMLFVTKGNLPPNLIIDVKTLQSDEILQTVSVESDGFFIIEGLAPGEYILQLVDLNKKIATQSQKLMINARDEWIKNYKWKIEN